MQFSVPTLEGNFSVNIEQGTSAIFVGANGSGKSRLAIYIESAGGENAHRISAPTKFEILEDIWDQLLPHRKLMISGDDIKVKHPSSDVLYSASDMSDGERAIFYLIGQVLLAKDDSLLIVDEPELHVHRSIMNSLWDLLESARPNCAFIFITHDLEFAAGRVAQKFAISEYTSAGPG